ncbi:glutamate-5-semialdehyde dehydrogenase [Microaceticoccus formicicus]|uniref:glutamate-5-semialdehyde dehydrogenase n=1 Tax=Microaceticoccus formicicus TaxID=3118105 RepID=UPI003CD00D79|nr:glutamate-5-semialdehyde dehydrogenase [Peptoniphilaceae bacterium AMB_02]
MLTDIGRKAKDASYELAGLTTVQKNRILERLKENLHKYRDDIVKANEIDMREGNEAGLSGALLDRLFIDYDRVDGMISSIDVVIDLPDPIGNTKEMKRLPNGLLIGKRAVPMGVVGIIYEARPNVTLDTSILCLKSSNALILRGGKEAINTNIAIAKIIRLTIEELGFNPDYVQLIENTDRESSMALIQLSDYLDLLIPRGSSGLIKAVVENSTVPVLETGSGNCHVYVDESADIEMALNIIKNAKTQRTGVCNAMESLLVHRSIGREFYDGLQSIVDEFGVIVHSSEEALPLIKGAVQATEEDYYTEYLDYEFSMKLVDDLDEAITCIRKYSTGHSEVIVTESYENSLKFLDAVDSACVYVNASSRFTDGGEFGMGAEMGISTQKLHARGPIGLEELTSTKFIILGNGQVR